MIAKFLNTQMENFKKFLEASEEKQNIMDMLSKLPKRHRQLIKGYRFKFEPGNTLKGDDDHVGLIDQDRKTITVAAPWNYGREFTLLHEVAHMVWEVFLTPAMKMMWKKIVASTKHKQNQNPEELFCMAYANHYAKHKVEIHNHPEWDEFIQRIPV
jgi:hypothetical protein